MVNNGNKNCGFEDAMVSYMYDEIGAAERSKFETHLVDCSVCTEEFAEMSGARFSIYEWQKQAFAELPTPEIVIPYAKAARIEAEGVGFFAGLRGLLGGFNTPLAAGAAVLICLGIGFAALTLSDADDQIAANVVVEQPNVQQIVVAEKPTVRDDSVVFGKGELVATDVEKENEPTQRDIKPVKAVVESKRSRPARQLTAETSPQIKREQLTNKKAPALSNFEEADDRSLRLTDLFDDEIGSIR